MPNGIEKNKQWRLWEVESEIGKSKKQREQVLHNYRSLTAKAPYTFRLLADL